MKVSFAVTLLLANVSARMVVPPETNQDKARRIAQDAYNARRKAEFEAQNRMEAEADAAVEPYPAPPMPETRHNDMDRMASNSTYAAQEADEDLRGPARDIVRAIDDLQRQIPQGDVSGKIGYTVNTAPIRAGLGLKKEFFKTDFKKFENAVQEVMGTPLQNAKLQVATQFAGVADSTFDLLTQSISSTFPDGDKCQARPFYDCLQTLPRWQRRGPSIFNTQCAKDNGCSPKAEGGQAWYQENRRLGMAAQQKWGNLAQSVAGEFQEVAQKQGQIIDGVGNKWMNKSVDFMKTQIKCDTGCVDDYMKWRSWTDYNEMDIMMRCPCEIPIKVAPVQDFEGKDFYKMTATDFMTILQDTTPPANETNEEKARRIAAEAQVKAQELAAKAKVQGQAAVDSLDKASGGNAMYIIGGVAVFVLGGVVYMCCIRDKGEDANEGGQDDVYSSLI